MADRMFEVLEGQKYTGKHKVYGEGKRFPESELFGNDDNHEIALKGTEDRDAKIKVVRAKQKKKKSDSESAD